MTNKTNSYLESEIIVNKIMEDLRGRVNVVFEKYSDSNNTVKLPDYDKLVRNQRLCYSLSRKYTNCIDELLEVRVRVSLVQRSINDMLNINATRKEDYSFVQNFKASMKDNLEELTDYKFVINDLVKNFNNKLKVLDTIPFMNE